VNVAVRASDVVTGVGLATYLESHDELNVVPCTPPLDAEVLVFAVESVQASSVEALRLIARQSEVRIVLLTSSLPEADLIPAVACRVVAVLPFHGTSGRELVGAVIDAASRTAVPPPDLVDELAEQIARIGGGRLLAGGLAPREVDVLRLLADGLDTAEIAQQLCYSERTVKNVLHALLTRMRLRNRQHAVAYALRAGII
jgi:DNA-binding NarL/FixJ family response regulator